MDEQQVSAARSDGGEPVLIADRYRVVPGDRVPELDSPAARAYAAYDEQDPAARLFCLAPTHLHPIRDGAIRELRRNPVPGVLGIVDFSAGSWPPLGRRAELILCQSPPGDRLAPDTQLSSPEIRRLVECIAGTLSRLAGRGIPHRALHPGNLFWTGPERDGVVLGECVSAPPGFGQPAAYETTENAGADPFARAAGSAAEDLYALGAVVLALTQKRRPWASLPPERLLVRKLEMGSAAAMIGGDPPPSDLLPLVRGLLSDDPAERWSLEQIGRWLGSGLSGLGRLVIPKLGTRPLRIGREQYRTARSVAFAMAADQRMAVPALRSGAVASWVRECLRDEACAGALDQAVRSVGRGPGSQVETLLVAHACLALDPAGPLRFGGIRAMPEAIGRACAQVMLERRPLDEVAALLRSDLFSSLAGAWLPPGATATRLSEITGLGEFGGGIERCVYELNPELHCLSPRFAGALPRSVAAFLAELEALARTADFETSLLDAHGVAFLAVRLRLSRIDLAALTAPAPAGASRVFFELRLLARAEAAAGIPSLPAATHWLAHRLMPVASGLRSRAGRKQLMGNLARRRESGSPGALLEAMDRPGLWQDDARGFAAARQECQRIAVQQAKLVAGEKRSLAAALLRGQQIASGLAAVASVVVLALAGILQVL